MMAVMATFAGFPALVSSLYSASMSAVDAEGEVLDALVQSKRNKGQPEDTDRNAGVPGDAALPHVVDGNSGGDGGGGYRRLSVAWRSALTSLPG
jgi:hypothetical protein